MLESLVINRDSEATDLCYPALRCMVAGENGCHIKASQNYPSIVTFTKQKLYLVTCAMLIVISCFLVRKLCLNETFEQMSNMFCTLKTDRAVFMLLMG